jgi:hypothetical protein
VEIEPAGDSAATDILPCGCVICGQCCAAAALHFRRPEWLALASLTLIAAWADFPEASRRAMLALVGSLK